MAKLTDEQLLKLRRLAGSQARPYAEVDELYNVGVAAVLEEMAKVGELEDGLIIVIAQRAIINYILERKFPVSVPVGSRYSYWKKYKGTAASLEDIEQLIKIESQEVSAEVKQALEIARKKTLSEKIFDAILDGWTIEEIQEAFGVSYATVCRIRRDIKKVFRELKIK